MSKNNSELMKLLLVNSSINSTSTGRIAEEIGNEAVLKGYDVMAAYGFTNNRSRHKTIKIGSQVDHYLHALSTRILDRHGLESAAATKILVKQLENLNPDIVNLHNIHGYYLNYPILVDYLKSIKVPVVWTLHDCWPFTGHCSYFDAVACDRWKSGCHDCPNKKGYPSSVFVDRSRKNFELKKELFCSLPNLTMVAPCKWMAENVAASFLGEKRIEVIYNGVDTEVFKPESDMDIKILKNKMGIEGCKVILGVASVWDKRKGLEDFIRMASMLKDEEKIVLIGLNDRQIKDLPQNIIGIKRTESTSQLAAFYSMANVFVNPTYVDNFPTTNIESLACGTPVATYRTGGSPEAIDDYTGKVVAKGDVTGLLNSLRDLFKLSSSAIKEKCRKRAVENFDCHDRFKDYVKLFNELCITTR